MFRKERYPADWKAIRAGILLRANNACEKCFAPNHTPIARGARATPAEGTYMLERGEVFSAEDGRYLGCARGSEYDSDRSTVIVLTVAHLDHDETHNDPSNLAALCQQCHLQHDAKDNLARRRERAAASSGQMPFPLLAVMPEHRGR